MQQEKVEEYLPYGLVSLRAELRLLRDEATSERLPLLRKSGGVRLLS